MYSAGVSHISMPNDSASSPNIPRILPYWFLNKPAASAAPVPLIGDSSSRMPLRSWLRLRVICGRWRFEELLPELGCSDEDCNWGIDWRRWRSRRRERVCVESDVSFASDMVVVRAVVVCCVAGSSMWRCPSWNFERLLSWNQLNIGQRNGHGYKFMFPSSSVQETIKPKFDSDGPYIQAKANDVCEVQMEQHPKGWKNTTAQKNARGIWDINK